MQFYSCQGNLTPSAKMQALLAITSAIPSHCTPLYPPTVYSCHVVPAPVVAAVFCLATLRYFLANDEVSRYILLLLPLFFSKQGGGSGKGRAHDTCIQGLMEGVGGRGSDFQSLLFCAFFVFYALRAKRKQKAKRQ